MSSHEEAPKTSPAPQEWNRITESLLSLSSEVTKAAPRKSKTSEKLEHKVAPTSSPKASPSKT